LIERHCKVLPQVAEVYEVVLVNDGSPDNSWEVIVNLAKKYDWVRGIALMRNYGQENATLCGIRAARYDVIVTMDDDLQHNPEELPNLLSKLDQGVDVVYGIPRTRGQPWWKSILSAVVKGSISSLAGLPAIRDMSGYKVFRSNLKKVFDSIETPDVHIDGLLSMGTTRFVGVQIEEVPRRVGRSNYNMNKLIKASLLLLTNYTTIPLRFASILGFLFTIVGFFVLIYVVTEYFTVGSIPGFSFLASAITIFSGVQLFALGIIGEYLARLFERTSGKQPYIVAETTGSGE
jgi:glycosyltransferase involved in cell wall biosynthesis